MMGCLGLARAMTDNVGCHDRGLGGVFMPNKQT
jgi:hypothetical protein